MIAFAWHCMTSYWCSSVVTQVDLERFSTYKPLTSAGHKPQEPEEERHKVSIEPRRVLWHRNDLCFVQLINN